MPKKKSPAQLQREIDEALAREHSTRKKRFAVDPYKAGRAQEVKIYDVDASIVSGIDGEDVWTGNFEIPANNKQAASKLAVELLRESTYYDPRIDPRVTLERVDRIGEVEVSPSETPEQLAATLIEEVRKAIP